MMLRFTSMAACLALAAPLYAQADEPETDGEINLESIDALFGGSARAKPEEDSDAAEEVGTADGSDDNPAAEAGTEADGPDSDEAAPADEDGEEAEADPGAADSEDVDEAEVSDLTRAFNSYSLCASEAGAALEEEGFSLDVVGQEALLRCSGQRAAYINAFYFDLLPHYPDSTEGEVRASAERLVAQSDAALMNIVTGEARELRNARPPEPVEETPVEDTPVNGEEEETEPDA